MFVFESDNCKFRLTQNNLDSFPNSLFTQVTKGKTHPLIMPMGTDFYNNTNTFICAISDKSMTEMIRYMRGYPIIESNCTQNDIIDLKKDAETFGISDMFRDETPKNDLVDYIKSLLKYDETVVFDPELFYTINLD